MSSDARHHSSRGNGLSKNTVPDPRLQPSRGCHIPSSRAGSVAQDQAQVVGRRLEAESELTRSSWPSICTPLTLDELWVLTGACKGRYRDVVPVLALAGLRWGELAGLQAGDRVSVPGLGLRLRRAVLASGGGGSLYVDTLKNNRARTVPLVYLVPIVDRWSEGKAPDAWLFDAPEGGPLRESNWKRSVDWAAATAAIGLQGFRVHDLRHTAASVWQGRGVAPDATFRRRRGAGAVRAAVLRASGLVGWRGAGHAAGAGVLARGCAGWQDAASRSVALGDRLMRSVHARRGPDGGAAGAAGAGCRGRRGAGVTGCGAAGDAGGVAVPAAGAQADRAADRRAGAGGAPVRRVHRVLATVMPWAAEALAQYIDDVRPWYGVPSHPALWLTERGERISPRSVDERFAAWRAAAGLPRELSVHCLRHTAIICTGSSCVRDVSSAA